MDVGVFLSVTVATTFSSPLTGINKDGVGEKKSMANASLVNARSRGVAVGENLGWRTMSSCVSGRPPAIMTGRLNARRHTPAITTKTIVLCVVLFTFIPHIPVILRIPRSTNTYTTAYITQIYKYYATKLRTNQKFKMNLPYHCKLSSLLLKNTRLQRSG